jgi:hypothetical protein
MRINELYFNRPYTNKVHNYKNERNHANALFIGRCEKQTKSSLFYSFQRNGSVFRIHSREKYKPLVWYRIKPYRRLLSALYLDVQSLLSSFVVLVKSSYVQ